MENPEEILHSLEEFAKLRPKDIPRELDEYLCFVAKTGDPVYQWPVIKILFREKLINVITEFYESCSTIDIPPCPNVDLFNYDSMKTFILEKLDTFVAAPFTVQRICELLTTPRKEYNRIDKYMRALEKNILVVSTTEPGNRTAENGDGFVNGIETEHFYDGNNDINIEEMDEDASIYQSTSDLHIKMLSSETTAEQERGANIETVITCCTSEQTYMSTETSISVEIIKEESPALESDVSITITAIPAAVQKRRDSIEPPNEVKSTDAEVPVDEPVDDSTTKVTDEAKPSIPETPAEINAVEVKTPEQLHEDKREEPTEVVITSASEHFKEVLPPVEIVINIVKSEPVENISAPEPDLTTVITTVEETPVPIVEEEPSDCGKCDTVADPISEVTEQPALPVEEETSKTAIIDAVIEKEIVDESEVASVVVEEKTETDVPMEVDIPADTAEIAAGQN